MSSIKPHVYSFEIQGVRVKPLTEDGKKISILYNGLLARKGAGSVYLHYGFGNQNNWQETGQQLMSRYNDGWEATIDLPLNRHLNFCFKDRLDNWDNNNGSNWSYRITGGSGQSKPVSAEG